MTIRDAIAKRLGMDELLCAECRESPEDKEDGLPDLAYWHWEDNSIRCPKCAGRISPGQSSCPVFWIVHWY